MEQHLKWSPWQTEIVWKSFLVPITPSLSLPMDEFPIRLDKNQNPSGETGSQRMQHLSHLEMCRKGTFSELLFSVFQFSSFFEGHLTNLLLDFLTWHTMCSTAFKRNSSGFMHITHWVSHAGNSHQLFCMIFHGKGILKNWQIILP